MADMPRRLFAACIAALLALGTYGAAAQEGDKETRARAATEQLLSEAHSALTSTGGDEQLRRAIQEAFAFDIWERFLIGDREDAFDPAQRQRFRELLPAYMAHLYHAQFDKGLDQPPAIGEVRPARNDVLVSATFKRADGRDLPVDWRLREFPDRGPQVIDVMVGGTSFLLLKRDEFAAMIEKGGADAVLSHMADNAL